ncbi:MAG: hypothetical protein ABSA71_04255 [Desulfomonilia bacterium]
MKTTGIFCRPTCIARCFPGESVSMAWMLI